MEAQRREAGRGEIAFERVGARTVLRTMRSESPLKLLAPRNHGHGAWVFAATFGGGLVSGDAISLDVAVGPEACGLIGTQASTKVYRCPEAESRQALTARVADGGVLVSIPDPVACFAEARYSQITRVDMAPRASVVLLDTLTAGRSARGERWDFTRCASRIAVTRDGAPLLVDAVVLDREHGDLRERMGRFDALATLLVAGPATPALREAALAESPPLTKTADLVVSANAIGEDGAIVRLAGTTVESVTMAARARLRGLASILGDDPFARKA